MTNQSTVPHSEISRRLSICSEFLSDEKKPIEEAYESLMEKIGLMEYTEFEYWFRRFQNNQFDLGYDTNQDEMKRRREFFCSLLGLHTISTASQRPFHNFPISRILDLNFSQIYGIRAENDEEIGNDSDVIARTPIENEQHVRNAPDIAIPNIPNESEQEVYESEENSDVMPRIPMEPDVEILDNSDRIMERKMDYRFSVQNVNESFQIHKRLKEIDIRFYDEHCTMKFDEIEIRLEKNGNNWMIGHQKSTNYPIKFIIDHLWMVLKNPKIQLKSYTIKNFVSKNTDSESLNSILQLMLDSIDHQIHSEDIWIIGFSEDTFLSMLKHTQPGVLYGIYFHVSFQENYQKLEDIVRTEQWKQAKAIYSWGVIPLKIKDLLHCDHFLLKCDSITPEEVLRVTQNWKLQKISTEITDGRELINYTYKLPHSQKRLRVRLSDDNVTFKK